MSIESITVDKFTEEKVDSNNSISDTGTLKKKVGFKVKHTNGQLLVIDKWVAIVDGKSDDDYSKDAYDAAKAEITAWDNSFTNIGKIFNPDTGKME